MKKFTLKILWQDNNIAFAIDHIVNFGYSPLTPYFFWPRNDGWNQIKTELDSKPWISENDKIDILNKITSITNYWQENRKQQSVKQARNDFPEITFYGD